MLKRCAFDLDLHLCAPFSLLPLLLLSLVTVRLLTTTYTVNKIIHTSSCNIQALSLLLFISSSFLLPPPPPPRFDKVLFAALQALKGQQPRVLPLQRVALRELCGQYYMMLASYMYWGHWFRSSLGSSQALKHVRS